MNRSQAVVADLHEAVRENGHFVKKSLKVKRAKMVVTQSHVDEMNGRQDCATFYVVDKEATDKFRDEQEKIHAQRAEKKAKKSALAGANLESLFAGKVVGSDPTEKGGSKGDEPTADELREKELGKMKVGPLKELCAQLGIELGEDDKKADFIEKIIEAEKQPKRATERPED